MLRMSVFFLVIVLLVRDSGDALLVGCGEIAAVAAAAAYSLYVQQHRIAPIRFLASVKTKDLIREAIPVGMSNVVWSAAQYAPLFLMGTIVGGSDTGIFAGANRLVASIATFSYVYHFNLYATAARVAAEDHMAFVALMRNSFRLGPGRPSAARWGFRSRRRPFSGSSSARISNRRRRCSRS